MPLAFQIAGQPADPLPSWRDPRYNDAPAVGMTPESIWNQAVSEYQWRLQHPHLDVWGRPMAEDTQEALERTVLGPARAAVGLPQPESPWSGPIETAGGGIYQVNKVSGAMRVIRPAGEPKQTTIHSPDFGIVQVDNAGNVRTLVPPKEKDGQTETITETYPAVPATEAMPEVPGKSGFLGWGSTPTIPAVPARPAVPQRRVEYKQPHVAGIMTAGTNVPPVPSIGQPITRAQVAEFLAEANGDREKARQIARSRGYVW